MYLGLKQQCDASNETFFSARLRTLQSCLHEDFYSNYHYLDGHNKNNPGYSFRLTVRWYLAKPPSTSSWWRATWPTGGTGWRTSTWRPPTGAPPPSSGLPRNASRPLQHARSRSTTFKCLRWSRTGSTPSPNPFLSSSEYLHRNLHQNFGRESMLIQFSVSYLNFKNVLQ